MNDHMQVLIQVTREDILFGKPNICYSCPVARAIERHLKKGFYPSVGSVFMKIISFVGSYRKEGIWLPSKVSSFINSFDAWPNRRLELQPFSFVLNLPIEVLELQLALVPTKN